MDEFFQELRSIQKKERSNSSLAKVGTDFYIQIHNYLVELKETAGQNLFSNEYYLFKDTQRIATEICERREHKITEAAVLNIHRSYQLFQGKPEFDLLDTTPLNLTEEEERLYFSIIDLLVNHRKGISINNLAEEEVKKPTFEKPLDQDIKLSKENNDSVESTSDDLVSVSFDNDNKPMSFNNNENVKEDPVLNRLDSITNAKVLTDEKVEPIEKQISKSNIVGDELSSSKDINPSSSEDSSKVISSSSSEDSSKDFIQSTPAQSTKNNDSSNVSNLWENPDDQFVNIPSNVPKKEDNSLILIFKELSSLIGVDEKIYGPFNAQDIVMLPKINAHILVKNRKGRLIRI